MLTRCKSGTWPDRGIRNWPDALLDMMAEGTERPCVQPGESCQVAHDIGAQAACCEGVYHGHYGGDIRDCPWCEYRIDGMGADVPSGGASCI